jgi:hypothetical protein
MIDGVSAPDTEHGALAHDLLHRAVSAFAALAPDERGPLLVALDAFLARPAPATYLAAVRVLAEARRAGALRQVRAARAGYALARGLDTVRRELGADTAEALGAIPADDRAGMRLRALALLSAAHRELAGRVAGSTELLRRQLELSRGKTASVPAPRRRPPPRLTRSGR